MEATNRSKPFERAGKVIAAASGCWLLGVSFVGHVHAVQDPATRLAILRRNRTLWVAGQFLTALGTAAVPVGFSRFAQAIRPGPAKALVSASAAALLAGAPLFIVDVADRAAHLERFAYSRYPGWPFQTYSALHVGALAAMGAGILRSPLKRWSGATPLAAAPVFGTILAVTKDIPPFVFYLVEGAVGIQLMRHEQSPAASNEPATRSGHG